MIFRRLLLFWVFFEPVKVAAVCEYRFRPERLNRRLALGAIFANHENVHAVAFGNRPFREIIPANA